MLLSKPMKTKSDEMKGEKEKIRVSSKKRGSLGEPIGKGDFDSSAFLYRIKQLIQSCRHKWSQEMGRPTPEVAVLGMVSCKNS